MVGRATLADKTQVFEHICLPDASQVAWTSQVPPGLSQMLPQMPPRCLLDASQVLPDALRWRQMPPRCSQMLPDALRCCQMPPRCFPAAFCIDLLRITHCLGSRAGVIKYLVIYLINDLIIYYLIMYCVLYQNPRIFPYI